MASFRALTYFLVRQSRKHTVSNSPGDDWVTSAGRYVDQVQFWNFSIDPPAPLR